MFNTSILLFKSNVPIKSGIFCSSSFANIIFAPNVKGIKISSIEISNEYVEKHPKTLHSSSPSKFIAE